MSREVASSGAMSRAGTSSGAGEPAFRIMGILNVTPDSFSDGGRFLDPASAVAHGLELAAEGADLVDVGGQSTRPGAESVAAAEELRRVVPVIERLAAELPSSGAAVEISVDTSKAAVARAALSAGATLVNDVTALRGDPEMAAVVAAGGARCCLMHMRGEPRTMQQGLDASTYGDVVDDVRAFLQERIDYAVGAGIPAERLLVDPGIGFGKTAAHNLTLLQRLDELVALGPPVLVGISRKSFLGTLGAPAGADAPLPPTERLAGTLAANVLALERGARVFRVHDVAPARQALAVAAATLAAT
jgi:dihydropteroate synthase